MSDTTTLIPAERIVQHLGYIDHLIRWMQPDDHELGACQEPESNFKGCELCAINGILQDVKWAGGRERTFKRVAELPSDGRSVWLEVSDVK